MFTDYSTWCISITVPVFHVGGKGCEILFGFKLIPLFPPQYPFHHLKKQDNYCGRTMQYRSWKELQLKVPYGERDDVASVVNPASHGYLPHSWKMGYLP